MTPSALSNDEQGVEEVPAGDVTVLRYEEKKKKRKAFDSLGLREVMVGSEAATALAVAHGSIIEVAGRSFHVSQVMEETGTVDDMRVFAHLHTVQDILGRPGVINAIEIVGCGCTEDLVKLSADIEDMLPATRVTTIRHIAETQHNTLGIMKAFSVVLLVIVSVIGGAGIAGSMSANVRERRREIAILLAMGATPRTILSVFLQKALFLGLTGGVIGYFAGTGLALFLGTRLLNVSVLPQPAFFLWSVVIAISLNAVFSFIPAYRAATLDPAAILEEQ